MRANLLIATVAAIAATVAVRSSARAQEPAAATTKSVWDSVYTDEQAKRGQSLYAKDCAQCHGTALEGVDMAPPLVGGSFTSNWNGMTIGDIFERIRKTMPDDNPGSLSREETADIVAFMLSVGKFPAGTTELATQTEVLKQIKFEATKPSR